MLWAFEYTHAQLRAFLPWWCSCKKNTRLSTPAQLQYSCSGAWEPWKLGMRLQQRMAKCAWKTFQEVSKISNTSPNTRIWSFLEAARLCFAGCCSLVLIDRELHRHFGFLSSLPFLHQSPTSFFLTLITIFVCHFDVATMRSPAHCSAGNDKLT